MFESAKKKIERGFACLELFSDAVDAYIVSKPASIKSNGKTNTVYTAIVMDKQIPIDDLINAGEAAHNFRSALDHCAWALYKGEQIQETKEEDIYFPIALKRRAFNKAIKDLKFKDSDLENHFRSLECYKSGKGALVQFLNVIDNYEKHRVITPAFLTMSVRGMTERSTGPGPTVVTAIPDEIHRFSSATTQSVPTAGGPVFGVKIIDIRPKFGPQIIDSYGTVDVEVGFQDPLSPITAPMVTVLQQIGNKVEDIILEVERRVISYS